VTAAQKVVREATLGSNHPDWTRTSGAAAQTAVLVREWGLFLLPRLIILAACALLWGQTVRFKFVWDDKFFIQRLESIRSLENVPRMFTSLEAQSSYPEGFVLFRPLRTVHYALLYALGGGEPPKAWLFHLANVVWHGAAALLFHSVALILFRRFAPGHKDHPELFALLAALAFAVNPVVSEVVCWVKSLDDLMAATFTLAALRALLLWSWPTRSYAWSLFYFLLAVYSKESAVPFALFSFFVFHLANRLPFARACRYTSGFLLAALIFVVHHHWVVGRTSQTAPISGSYGQTLIDMLPVVPAYARLLLGLPPFCIDYSFLSGGHSLLSAAVLGGLGLLLGFAVFAAWGARRDKFRLASLGLIWAGLFLLPVSNLVPMMQYMAERFLYLPLLGWVLSLTALLALVPRWRFAATLCGVFLAYWSVTAWQRSGLWRDEVTLFVESARTGPKTARVEENAVAAFFDLPEVRQAFTRSRDNPKLFVPVSQNADWNAAIETLEQARRLFPDDDNALNCLAIACARGGQPARAVKLFQQLAHRRPLNAQYWANLGQACFEARDGLGAEQALSRALALQPDQPQALRTLAALHWQRGDFGTALQTFEKLQQLEPANPENGYWIQRAKLRLNAAAGIAPSPDQQ
jgi:tetratricopeptide (TPR) repeat protein